MLARVAAAACMLALAAQPMAAQSRARTGLWMDGLIGYGRLKLTCNGCSDIAHARGTSLTFAFGGTPRYGVALGVEAQFWRGTDESVGGGQRVRSVGLIAQWYPSNSGFFIRGGTGLATGLVAPADTSLTRTAVRGSGMVLSIGAGFDLALSRRWALTAHAGTRITALGDLVLPGLTADDTIAYVTQLSLGLTLR